MATVMVRVDEGLHRELKAMAEREGKTLQAMIAEMAEEYQARHFWEEVSAAYASLQAEPAAWREEMAERAAMEGTLMDDMDRNEVWHEDGTVTFVEERGKPNV